MTLNPNERCIVMKKNSEKNPQKTLGLDVTVLSDLYGFITLPIKHSGEKTMLVQQQRLLYAVTVNLIIWLL
jgi:hypothetical protein